MVFGTTTFKCDECGNSFETFAVEWRATCFLSPMPCTKCGSIHTMPASASMFVKSVYQKIWAEMDKKKR